MPMEKIEFEFPDDGDEAQLVEVEGSSAVPLGEEPKPKKEEDELEVEVIDDTPEADRGREPSDPPEDITDDELQDYSEKVRKRIQHFSKGYHDERRAKEKAERERSELERVAKKLYDDNQRLNTSVGQSQAAIYDQATKAVATELTSAKTAYKEAYEAGNADALLEAQDRLTSARMREEQLKNIGAKALQRPKPDVQQETQAEAPTQTQAPVTPDKRSQEWAKENTWFGQSGKDEMTALALGYHTKLLNDGVDPTSDSYYEKLNARMRTVFPEEFGGQETRQKRPNVVAPATRSTSPRKVKLTQTQVAIAKRLGVPLELYAKQVAEDMRKENG